MSEDRAGTVSRVINLLRAMSLANSDATIADLSAELALPPSTVHRLLHLLIAEGVVERSHVRGRYRAGIELMRLGAVFASRNRLPDVASPFMQRLASQSGETCTLHVYLPATLRITAAAIAQARQPLGFKINFHRPGILTWGASGKALLPYLPEDKIRAAYVSDKGSPADGRRLPPYPDYVRQLVDGQRQGYVASHGEKTLGAAAMGATLFAASGAPIGTLNIALSSDRFDRARESRLADTLLEQVKLLNNALGFAQGAVPSRIRRPAGPSKRA